MTADIREQLLEKVEEGVIDKDGLILRMVAYMSTNDVKDMLQCNEMLDIVTPPVISISRKVYFDSAHSWLEVDYQELLDLGITKRITNWSYRDDKKVYLEEDIDAGTYIDAVEEQRGLVVAVNKLNVADNPLRNPEDRVDPRKLKRFYANETCVLCEGDIEIQKTPEGKVFWTKGHNPSPLAEEGGCCATCNAVRVIPERLKQAGYHQL